MNVTLCFSPNQALLAAKAGAAYVSPFVGRLDDISSDGMGLIEDIMTILSHYEYATEVLVASVRHRAKPPPVLNVLQPRTLPRASEVRRCCSVCPKPSGETNRIALC